VVSLRPDPDVEKSNAAHKGFIDVLNVAFETIGGTAALSAATASTAAPIENKNDLDQLLLANKFAALDLEGVIVDEDTADRDSDDADEPGPSTSKPHRRKQAKSGKGKNGKRSKKQARAAVVDEAKLEDVPLESYHIIQTDSGRTMQHLSHRMHLREA